MKKIRSLHDLRKEREHWRSQQQDLEKKLMADWSRLQQSIRPSRILKAGMNAALGQSPKKEGEQRLTSLAARFLYRRLFRRFRR